YVKHVLGRAILCSVLLVLPSCAVPHLRQPDLGLALPGTFNGLTSPENWAQLGFGEFFNDPLLTCLIDQALVGNRELKVLNEEIEVARNAFLARTGAYLPFVGFRGGASLERFGSFTLPGASLHDDPYLPDKHLPNPVPDFLLGLNFFMPVDLWREL